MLPLSSKLTASAFLLRVLPATAVMLLLAIAAHAQVASLSKGQQILVDRGMQINGLVALTSDPFHLSTLQSTNFTAPLWAWTSDVSKLGAAPGAPWAKWFDWTTQNDLTAAESPYRSNLVQLYVGDEQFLYQSDVFNSTRDWINNNRSKFPTTMILTNQWGTEVAESTMIDFVSQANPDAVNFDNYPYVAGSGSYIAEEYADLSKYRRLGLGSYISASGNAPRPYGLFIQTYQSTGDGRRAPSDSEMRRDLFAAWTAGFTFASTFTYNSGASTLFTSGDNTITTLGTQFKESARESRNLSPTLVKLISKGAAPRFIAGQESDGSVHAVPSGWSSWVGGAEGDPYTASISVANTGTKNNGHPGDVLVGYFNPMLDSYDGPAYTNEQYFMVTNGLADPTGAVAECKQDVTLDFNFIATGINSLQRLRRSDGQVETVPLTQISANHYRVTLSLDGGTGDLFKFNDGAPFVGSASPALVYWDSDASAANNNSTTGAGTGGSGTWNGSSSTWYNGNSSAAWSSGKHAIFWGTAGTVTLTAPQAVGSLAFLTDSYTLSGSTVTMTGAAVMADTGVTANIGSVLAGTLGMIKNGAGIVNLTAANTYGGGTTINAGVLGVATSASLGAVPTAPAINIAINNGATLRLNGSGIVLEANRQIQFGSGGGVIETDFNNTVAGNISGSTVTKKGAGTLALTGINSHMATVISGGAINVSSDASLGAVPASMTAGNIVLDGGTLQFGGNFDVSNNRGITLGPSGGTIDTQSFSNPTGYNAAAGGFTGTGDLTKLGTGTFFAAAPSGGANNSWKGKLIIKQGTWKIVATDGLPYNVPLADGLQAGQVTLDGGTWEVGASVSATNVRRGVTIAAGGGTVSLPGFDLTWAGPWAGNVPTSVLNIIGSGTLRLNSTNVAPGSYAGIVNVNGGTLRLDGGTAMGDLAAINMGASGALSITGSVGEIIGSLAGGSANGGNVSLATSLTTGGNNNTTTYGGVISGSGGLIKAGSGVFTLNPPLSGGNSYLGGTTIADGTLFVMNSTGSATGTGAVAVNSGAVLGGTGIISGAVTNSGTIAPGNNLGTLHLGSNYTQLSVGRLEIELSAASHDELSVAGNATLGGTLAVALAGGYVPHDGDVFQILTAGSLGGSTFASTNLPALTGGLFWNINYSTKAVALAVAAPGDFNGDGVVDSADYIILRKGSPTMFGPLDYNAWRTHFGQTYPTASASGASVDGAVPEPGSLALLSILAVAFILLDHHSTRLHK